MGVRGLSTFIKQKRDVILKPFVLHDDYLVIDGYGLCFYLFRKFTETSLSAFGGEYDKYSIYVKNYFEQLRQCNIIPLVVFDGCAENNKFQTLCLRRSKSVILISRFSLDPRKLSDHVSPVLLTDVFEEVLTQLNIQYTASIFEADKDIAFLAQLLNCCVLGLDSDYFIYNVNYISLEDIQFKNFKEESSERSIKCRLYEVDSLTKNLGLSTDLLPLVSLLLGNDYVDNKIFENLFIKEKLLLGDDIDRLSISRLIYWLKNETFDSAVDKIKHSIQEKYQKEYVQYCITSTIKMYTLESDIINNFHIDIEKDFPNKFELKVKVQEYKINNPERHLKREYNDDEQTVNIPKWLKEGVMKKDIPISHIKLYMVKYIFYWAQAEDYNEDDAYLCVLPIVRYAFDILTDSSDEPLVYMTRKLTFLKEGENNLDPIEVTKILSVERPIKTTFPDLNKDQKKLIFTHFLTVTLPEIDFYLIEKLPSDFQLQIIAVCWWVKNCKVYLFNILTFIISYEVITLLDILRLDSFTNSNFKIKYSQKISELKSKQSTSEDDQDSKLIYQGSELVYDDCLLAADSLFKYVEVNSGANYDIGVVHSFAQLQCCLMELNYLNTLCGLPFESTKYSKMNVTFMYNLALNLKSQENPLQFIMQLFNDAKSVQQFFNGIYSIYKKCEQKMKLTVY